MTTVTSLTADRMLAIEAASVVDGDVVGDNLILTKHDGSQINAGSVRGPQGNPGPVGTDLAVVTAAPVLDVGVINQIRAGRQLTAADFTNMGLSAPLGLWNLSDLSDVSGNGRNLLNKGAVGFGNGINGVANTAAQFTGAATQGLYIPDTGANDPFRIRTGSFGCWFKTAKQGVPSQGLIGKYGLSSAANSFLLLTNSSSNTVDLDVCNGASSIALFSSVSIVTDDRWHFVVVTIDGSIGRMWIDGNLEASTPYPNLLNSSATAPLNIGGYNADGSTVNSAPHFGRIDEAFVTSDVLSEDQIRNLYCAKIPHTLAAIPSRVSLNVRRRRRGATFVVADFPTQPLRLHNFSGGSLGDEGSQGMALVDTSGVGGSAVVSGADGSNRNAYQLSPPSTGGLISADTGLPAGAAARSLGCWFKTVGVTPCYMINYGVYFGFGLQTGGLLITTDGSANMTSNFVADGQWHFGVFVIETAPIDGLKEKMYVDGRIVSGQVAAPTAPLGGANHFRVGALADGSSAYGGMIDGVFLCDYALTAAQIASLHAKGSQTLSSSPKNVGDHIEGMDANSLLALFDMLDSQHQVDLKVAA